MVYKVIAIGEEAIMLSQQISPQHGTWEDENQFVRIEDMVKDNPNSTHECHANRVLRALKERLESKGVVVVGTSVQLVDIHHSHSDSIKKKAGDTGIVVHAGGYGWPDGKVKVAFGVDTFEEARQATDTHWISPQWLECQSKNE